MVHMPDGTTSEYSLCYRDSDKAIIEAGYVNPAKLAKVDHTVVKPSNQEIPIEECIAFLNRVPLKQWNVDSQEAENRPSADLEDDPGFVYYTIVSNGEDIDPPDGIKEVPVSGYVLASVYKKRIDNSGTVEHSEDIYHMFSQSGWKVTDINDIELDKISLVDGFAEIRLHAPAEKRSVVNISFANSGGIMNIQGDVQHISV